MQEDQYNLRKRLGLGELINEILPEASEATQGLFKHFDATSKKVRLLGKNYGYRYMRTNTPTNESGSLVAHVGGWDDTGGLIVVDWFAGDGLPFMGAVRWVVLNSNR